MKFWRLALVLFCGLLATAALVVCLDPQTQVKAEWIGNWYFKDGGWMDYAPSGVPDFDQKQANWGYVDLSGSQIWTYCGPAAAANSLWWFDSKFEDNYPPVIPPPAVNDNYFLITTYPPFLGLDDHDPMNVGGMTPGLPGLIDDLAWYFDTDGQRTSAGTSGTNIKDMFYGLQWWLYGTNPSSWPPPPPFIGQRLGNYYDEYHAQMVKMPTWEWVVEEVERSEDVILLLGFWQQYPTGGFERLGGHYVTVAGINDAEKMIAFSDPYFDNHESGGPGRFGVGMIFGHPIPHPSFIHNDAGSVSHDFYSVWLTPTSPAGAWEILGYGQPPASIANFVGQNKHPEFDFGGDPSAPFEMFVEVEYAIAVSPFTWKPGGEWVYFPEGEEWEWWAYEDDGDSCIPDFAWSGISPLEDEVYDAATALADSLWWFDSKAETLVTGGWPVPPPLVNDNYPLLTTYGLWDDHDPLNTNAFVNDLAANYLNTSQFGTSTSSMAAGIQAYLQAKGVADDFYTKTQEAPSFEWVASEVEACEDVLMLLGFYEDTPTGWERKGGHWVDAAGVSQASGQIGLSDPWFDNANVESFFDVVHTGRVFPPDHLGRPFTETEKLHPQAISHDIYFTAASPVAPYQWALEDYPIMDLIPDVIGLNGGGELYTGGPISTVVEWAIGVSPYADLVITKTVMDTQYFSIKPIEFVIEYANTGLAAVSNMLISDSLPLAALANLSYTASPPLLANPGPQYSWTIPKLSYGQSGVITITAVVTEPLTTGLYTNTVMISAPPAERSPANNSSHATFLVDVDPPETTIDSGPPAITNTFGADFTFSGDDGKGSGVAGFQCQLNSGGWSACGSPMGFTVASDGVYTFEVYAIDNFGMADPTPAQHSWMVDSTPPTVTLTSTPPDPSKSSNAAFEFSGGDGSGSGVTGYFCKLDSGAWEACVSGKSYSDLSDGSHTFYVYAVDAAGNNGTPTSYTWVVDVWKIYLPLVTK
ncbi:MAG: DUF11 domain-containing protein [Anaerolineales bacterium]|nr:DUF11 domain-containing protein [Anaerolineales bacterium]